MSAPSTGKKGMARDEFMLRVTAALGPRNDDDVAPPKVAGSLVRRVRAGSTLVKRFCEEVERSGMTVSRFAMSGTANHIAEVLKERSVKSAIVSCVDTTIHALARKAAKLAGVETPDVRMIDRDQLFACSASITDVHAAVAETGSLVMTSHGSRPRLAHLVPEMHIAIVRAEQIVPDLLDLYTAEDMKSTVQNAAYTALITGPSKTADIEGVLITGVHGPGAVHVVVVE